MLRVHKIKLIPNKAQENYFSKACGTARFAYNWALAEWKRQHESGLKPSEISLRSQLNAIKRDEFPWMLEVSKVAPQQAIKNLGTAYANAFRRIKQGKKKPQDIGFPKFKKKGIGDSFKADNGGSLSKGIHALTVENKVVKLPIIGKVKMTEPLRFKGLVTGGTVSKLADGWYIAITVETNDKLKRRKDLGAVGVDLGIKSLAVLSDGTEISAPNPYKRLHNRLKRIQRKLSKKILNKGGANYRKAKTKLAMLHKRIADIRKDQLHKATHLIAANYSVIGIEDLHVKGMVKNRKLSKSISDIGFGEFRRQLEYKADMTGAQVVLVNRFFPSSKTCSGCGQVHDMPLSKRVMDCDCGLTIDRDLNAAINLKAYAVSSTVSACGVPSSGVALKAA